MSVQFACQFPVKLKRYVEGAVRDDRGRETGDHAAPVEIKVFAWYIGGTETLTDGHTNRTVHAATCYPQSKDNVSELDQIELPGFGWFEVDGQPTNYDHNPFWSPGLVDAKLKAVGG
ncbi:hypothetical protein CH302_01070 [Rhodococcus sp. 15-2388-1-1a]|uniref:hypothetical protein n=1 Tax=Nocardiaceae TaxID=85025 RepID=UPI000565879B|nr:MULTISPECIES: hypothetical protein [Rhodococcus]OZF05245.1 hypothetical protein CH302_01070 [Rhodococcus sp. 15-2388-1-1a]